MPTLSFRHAVLPCLLLVLLFTACAPTVPGMQPATPLPSATPLTASATYPPPPSPQPSATARAFPTSTPAPSPTLEPLRYGEPAGCQPAMPSADLTARMEYAEQLLGEPWALRRRAHLPFWDPGAGREMPVTEVAHLNVQDLKWKYQLQELASAAYTAGLLPWLRQVPERDLTLLLIPLHPDLLGTRWEGYIQAWFDPSASAPPGDEYTLPLLRHTPCHWMVANGLAPDLPAGLLEAADWSQPDLPSAATPFLAADTDAAFAIAREINWQPENDGESPANMCGPLVWAEEDRAAALPPGYGGWSKGSLSFWLPDPRGDGRPWNMFPPWLYRLRHVYTPIADEDFHQNPFHPGDMIYTFATRFGFDHILLVTESDAEGNTWGVSNVIHNKPVRDFTIRRILLYSLSDDSAGMYRNDWKNDRRNGLTGQGGFDVFTWAWRAKDITGEPAPYTVRAGDNLPLIASVWKTPPERIAEANGLDPSQPLTVGRELLIPPNPAP